ncbi:MAG TPA: hypothetical protein VFH73_14425 [Polyangia bacterium]|nr:hypothetical protein [Polyangia bacterium]
MVKGSNRSSLSGRAIAIGVVATVIACHKQTLPQSVGKPVSICAAGHTISVLENKRYGTAVEVCGHVISPDGIQRVWEVERLYLRDKAGAGREFVPDDAASLQQSFGYYADVWSPDQEFLVLPLGRFEGFAVMVAAKGLEGLAAGQQGAIRLVDPGKDGDTGLWHEFGGWRQGHLLEFSAGLSGDKVSFTADVTSGRVWSATANRFEAITTKGRSKVLPSPPQ